jgi:hypothetical protein
MANSVYSEGIEDLTGGITTELFATDILDKEKFWEELKRVNVDFLFGCGQMGGISGSRKGILEKHAYSIIDAAEIDNERLLKLRNPWGKTEWTGPWSDGSEQWTPKRMEKLGHRFGDDGVFWISYRDLLRHYQHFDRTRLFGPDWRITQEWTSVSVPWSIDYLPTHFRFSLPEPSDVVIVLSQLDTRYFRGLEGEYEFELHFLVCPAGSPHFTTSYLVRSNRGYYMRRGVSAELANLEAGDYDVHLKITATRIPNLTAEEVVRHNLHSRRQKLLAIGLSHDTAHARAGFEGLEWEQRVLARQNRKEALTAQKRKAHDARRKQRRKDKLRSLRRDELRREKEAKAREEAEAEAAAGAEGDNDMGVMNSRLAQLRMENGERGRAGERAGHASGHENGHKHARTSSLPSSTIRPGEDVGMTSLPAPPPTAGMNGDMPPRRATSPVPPVSMAPPIRERSRAATLAPSVPGIRVSSSPSRSPRMGRRGSSITLSEVSDDDVSFDSEIDGFSSDGLDEMHATEMLGGSGGMGGAPSMGLGLFSEVNGPGDSGPKVGGGDDSDDEPEVWNAVCVVGLRVFAQVDDVAVEVIRPGLAKEKMKRIRKGIDVDDKQADTVARRRKGYP